MVSAWGWFPRADRAAVAARAAVGLIASRNRNGGVVVGQFESNGKGNCILTG